MILTIAIVTSVVTDTMKEICFGRTISFASVISQFIISTILFGVYIDDVIGLSNVYVPLTVVFLFLALMYTDRLRDALKDGVLSEATFYSVSSNLLWEILPLFAALTVAGAFYDP